MSQEIKPGTVMLWTQMAGTKYEEVVQVRIAGKVSWTAPDTTYATVCKTGRRVLCGDSALSEVKA